ncbi:enoyl-CoA hydratase-related protein [Glaciimonas sp. CA11.2]|uniref:enoyl-CoA hydratase-related protein n=1 Tax=unclassified Glaciimonas TaxID=2644401 RepID=UPI002AB3D2BC|nr:MULTISPECIES: enoyl-CoA hydratase-related protein [unclassified Glaciimonas]MDY7545108.1 enoyl-CoA hydratase-related protein [Glaciimonas sp. CA11.2]MEB0011424.1 enoyl-CoA hydratase-related protein [Glaciimonas sp. Cout2]MEB0081075.1 enoyl-CoA hydratase-related protein [Glaciimonas sp. Gout2]MEB0163783.1 enoyl-CoA hydratase-related protein [Glaciimonas sp. CA11.2]
MSSVEVVTATSAQEIACAFEGGICHIEINRPDKRNALTMPMFVALAESLALAESREDVKAVLVTGTGQAFCAGHDLQAFAEWPQGRGDPVPRFLHAIAELRKPLVLAVHGSAAGIGVTWMLHADWVICSPDAALRLPFVDLAIAPEAASSILLARAIGLQRARCLLMGGEPFTGKQAHEWGLVTELAEADQVRVTAWQRARMLAAKDAHALRQIKSWLHPAGGYTAQIDAEIAAINETVLRRSSGQPN